jgi:hypothetical protein
MGYTLQIIELALQTFNCCLARLRRLLIRNSYWIRDPRLPILFTIQTSCTIQAPDSLASQQRPVLFECLYKILSEDWTHHRVMTKRSDLRIYEEGGQHLSAIDVRRSYTKYYHILQPSSCRIQFARI